MMKRLLVIAILMLILPMISSCEDKEGLSSVKPVKALFVDLLNEDYTIRDERHKDKVNLIYAFPSGKEMKEALLIHPFSETDRLFVDYKVDLRSFEKDALILFQYSIGFIDNAMPDGVEFSVFVNNELMKSTVTNEVKWIQQAIDLSQYAGQEITLSLATKGEPSIRYAQAGYGEPRIIAIEKSTMYFDGTKGNGDKVTPIIEGKYENSSDGIKSSDKMTLSYKELDSAGYILAVKGNSEADITVNTKVIGPSSKLYDKKENGKFISVYFIPGAVTKRSDWELGLGLPDDVVNKSEYDKAMRNPRNLEITINSNNEYTVESIELWRCPGDLEVSSFVSNAYKDYEANDVKVNVIVKNSGSGPILKDDGYRLILQGENDKGKKLSSVEVQVPDIAFNSDAFFTLGVGKLTAGNYNFMIKLRYSNGFEKSIGKLDLEVQDGFSALQPKNDKTLMLEGKSLKLYAVKDGERINEAYLYKDDGKPMGAVALPRLYVDDDRLELSGFDIKKADTNHALLEKQTPYGLVQVEWELAENSLKMNHQFIADKKCSVYAFDGPKFLAGAGSFERLKDSAIFGGIDYLTTEPSNNTLAIRRGYNDRFAPHPKKITVPAMSLAKNGDVIVYKWDPLQYWVDGKNLPIPHFEAPSLEGKGYSLMGIFVPSGTQYIKENMLTAENPYNVDNGIVLKLSAQIDVISGKTAADGIYNYVKSTPLPELPKADKDIYEVYRALVDGHEKELINENGWIGFLGLDTTPSINTESIHTLITAQYMLGSDYAFRAKNLIKKLKLPQPRFEWSYADSIWLRMDEDYIDSYYSNANSAAEAFKNRQLQDGMWSFNPSTPNEHLFGKAGDKTMGTTAVPIIHLIKATRLTGNESYWESALKGINALATFAKPAGAGPWELPNTNPDELAAVLALKACLDAYEYRPSEQLLNQAIEIAKMSLPFIYMYEVPQKKVSLFTVVPSFGATNWMRTWQGSPVMWQGALMAEEFKRLAVHDSSIGWREIATGITNQCVNLVNNKSQPGRFPDFLDLFRSDRTIYNIWGNLVVRTMQTDAGCVTRWDEVNSGDVKLVSGYEITEFRSEGRKTEFSVNIPKDMPCYMIVKSSKITQIAVNNTMISEQDKLDNLQYGYRMSGIVGGYVLKVTGGEKPVHITVSTNP